MILTFESSETAALFTAQRRSEGYFARTLDWNMSNLWFPSLIGGVRVLISEEPIPEEAPAAPPIIWSRFLMPALGILTLALILGGVLSILVLVLQTANPNRSVPEPTNFSLILGILAFPIVAILVSLFMIWATRRDRLRRAGDPLSIPMALITVFLILGYLDSPLLALFLFIFW